MQTDVEVPLDEILIMIAERFHRHDLIKGREVLLQNRHGIVYAVTFRVSGIECPKCGMWIRRTDDVEGGRLMCDNCGRVVSK